MALTTFLRVIEQRSRTLCTTARALPKADFGELMHSAHMIYTREAHDIFSLHTLSLSDRGLCGASVPAVQLGRLGVPSTVRRDLKTLDV